MAESEILADLVGEPQHRQAGEHRSLSATSLRARDGIQAGPNLSAAAQVLVPPAPRKLEDGGVPRPRGDGVSARDSLPASSLT